MINLPTLSNCSEVGRLAIRKVRRVVRIFLCFGPAVAFISKLKARSLARERFESTAVFAVADLLDFKLFPGFFANG